MKILISAMLFLGLSVTMPAAIPTITFDDDDIDITEWKVPWDDTRPRDPYVAPDGKVWFCGQKGDYIAYLEPESGEFKRFEIPKGSHPHNLIIDEKGMVWYAGNRNAHIGKLNPKNGKVERYPMPNPAARDPHTLVFDQKGDIWFTVQGGNFVGKLETASGYVEVIEVPTKRSRPYGIKVDPNNRPWIVLFGSHKIITVDPVTMKLEEIELPRTDARPRRMEITSDGMIWYVDYAKGFLGRLHPETHEVQEWPLPSGEGSKPYGTARDDQDRIWLVESGPKPNKLIGFDPKSETFFSNKAIPSGGGTVRYMYFHPTTKEIWFGADTNTIGRVRIYPQTEL
ncbi:MAG: lyase [Rhodothermales bacterium]